MNRYNHANESAESKIPPGAILPCESAEELNRALESCVSIPSLDRNTFLWDSERAATLIAAHDAKVKRELLDAVGTERASVVARLDGPEEEVVRWRDLRDAILGEGKA